jgi:hypothetical protein
VAAPATVGVGLLAVTQARDYREDARLEQIGLALAAMAEDRHGSAGVIASTWAHRGAVLQVLTVGDPRLRTRWAVAKVASEQARKPDAGDLADA